MGVKHVIANIPIVLVRYLQFIFSFSMESLIVMFLISNEVWRRRCGRRVCSKWEEKRSFFFLLLIGERTPRKSAGPKRVENRILGIELTSEPKLRSGSRFGNSDWIVCVFPLLVQVPIFRPFARKPCSSYFEYVCVIVAADKIFK
jgi:hypothetical protein